ncbi:MAG: indole-3-glycerol phosphate synthase TrpC [Candidatus Eutrophobiaceae bacterium]
MSNALADILRSILDDKRQWVEERSRAMPLAEIKARIDDSASDIRGFVDGIQQRIQNGKPAVIAEIKKASPSKGVLREDFQPQQIAQSYANNGAACLSVLTDLKYFQGMDEHLRMARAACTLPILRKDFIIKEWQIFESKWLGADCILLIVSALSDGQMRDFSACAQELGMDVLVEVHDRTELERGLMLRTPLIGINNRNLHTFETRLQVTLEMLSDVFYDRTIVTESGIHTPEDVRLMRSHNVNAFLIGEAFMREEDPGEGVRRLFGQLT